MSQIDMLKDILRASDRIYDLARRTPLDNMEKLSKKIDCEILIKREDLQSCRSFKIRGAYNRIAQLSDEQKSAGVVCASAGNHAQGVAISANHSKINAIICMPRTTPTVKIEATRTLGGKYVEVRLIGTTFDEARAESERLARDHNYTIIPPYDDHSVIAGQGTIAMELFSQAQPKDIDMVIIPCGGGGLLAGVATYIKELHPHIEIVAAEPEDSACCRAAVDLLRSSSEENDRAEPPVLQNVGRFADGVAVKQLGCANFTYIKEHVNRCVTVSTDEISQAMMDIYDDLRAIAEPAGALSVAAAKKLLSEDYTSDHPKRPKRIITILSGANMNFRMLRYIAERCEQERFFCVELPHESGQLLKFCKTLESWQITAMTCRLIEGDTQRVFVGVAAPDREVNTWLDQMISNGYRIKDLSNNSIMKEHVRYMIGGSLPEVDRSEESTFVFQFPEAPGALVRFLEALGFDWNITLFHFRSIGAPTGSVFVGWCPTKKAGSSEGSEPIDNVPTKMLDLGWEFVDSSKDEAYQLFLSGGGATSSNATK